MSRRILIVESPSTNHLRNPKFLDFVTRVFRCDEVPSDHPNSGTIEFFVSNSMIISKACACNCRPYPNDSTGATQAQELPLCDIDLVMMLDDESCKARTSVSGAASNYMRDERFKHRCDGMRPPFLLFHGQFLRSGMASQLIAENHISGYLPILHEADLDSTEPGHDECTPTSERAKRFRSFIQHRFDPVSWLGEQQSIRVSDSVTHCLEQSLRCWRRDTPEFLDAIAEYCHDHRIRLIDTPVWLQLETDILKEVRQELAKAWDVVLRPYLDKKLTHVGRLREDRMATSSRFAYYSREVEIPDKDAPGKMKVVDQKLIVFDPRRHYDAVSLEDIQWIEGRASDSYREWPDDDPHPQAVNRIPLPRNAPASTTPWLLACWVRAWDGGEVYSIYRYRNALHQEGRAVRSSLNYLLDQLDRQLAADRAEKKQGYDRPISMRNGLTLDTLIIGHYEPERKGVRIDRRWPAPIWPIEALKLPPCPDDERLNHSQYNSYMKDHSRSSDRQADGAATIKRWIDVCLYWLATGSMPNDYAPNQQIQSIIRDVADVGKQREWTFRSWFRRPIREATFCLRDEARTDKLDTPRRSCDVDGGPAVLAMSAEEDVVRLCETYVVCRVEADNCDDYIPFLEQTAFTDRVSFTNCRIENENGELAPCVILNCHFQKGLNLSGIDASCVILRNCTFEGGDPLKDLSTRTYERGSHRKSLRLDRVRAETIRIEDCLLDGEAIVAYSTVEELQVFDVNCLRGKNAAELTIGTQTTVGSMLNVKQFHAMCVNITIGRYSAASGRIELDVAGEETVLSIEKSKFHGAPRILLQDHASAKVHSTTVDDTMFVLITRGSTHSDVLFRECRLMSDVVFLDDKRTVEDDPSATLPAERPNAVFADCHLERSLKVHPLCLCDLTLSDTKILRDLRFFGPSQSLRMDSVIVGGFLRLTAKEDFRRFGNLLIKQSRLGGITAEELQFTGDVMITSSTITGAISFSDSHFDQAVTLGDPEASKTLHFESGLRKLRIVRDGVEDADDASFSIHQHEWSHVICQEELSFIRCVFRKDLDLSHLICSLVASLQGATFEHDASLIATQMRIGVYLDCESTTFCGNVLLREADISGELEMRSARFFGEQLFLEETNCGRLDLSYATFLSEPAPGDAAMSEIPSCALRASRLHTKLQLDCQGTRFGAVVDLSESEIGAEVDLSGADLRACETLCFRRASMRTSVDLSECLWDNPRGSWRPLKRSLSFLFSRKSARAVPHVDFSGASITRRLSIQKPYRHREEGKNGEEIRRPADPIWIKLENANLQDLDVSNSVVHYSFRRSLGMKALSESWPRVFWLPVFVLLALWRVLVLWTIGELWMTGYSLFQLMIGKGKGDAAQAKANMARLHKELASRKMDYGNVDRFHCWESWFSFFPGVRLMSLFAWRHGTTWKLPVLWMALLSLFSLTVLIMSPVDDPFSSEVHWRDRARTGFSEFWRNEDSTSYHLVASALIEIYPEFLQEKHRTQATSPTTPAPGSDAHAAPETAGLRAVHGLPGWAVTLLACSFVCKCLFANLFFVALFRKFVR